MTNKQRIKELQIAKENIDVAIRMLQGKVWKPEERRKATATLKRWIAEHRGNWRPDWGDVGKKKYSVYMNYYKGEVCTTPTFVTQSLPNWAYMPTDDMAIQCAEECEDEWKIYFGG